MFLFGPLKFNSQEKHILYLNVFYWEKNTPESKLNHNYGGVLQLMAAVM